MKCRFRYDKYDVSKFQFIAFMIGESEYVFGKPVSIYDIAPALGVSKPTASKFLKRMIEVGYLVEDVKQYRRNAVKYEYWLTREAYNKYLSGVFTGAYEHYKALVFQIRALEGKGKLSI